CPQPLEPLRAHAQGQIWALEEGIDRVPHYWGKVLRWHRFQHPPVLRIVLGTLWRKRGKTVIGVECVHYGLDPLGHGHIRALEELHRQVGLADHAAGDVGRHNCPYTLRVAHRTPKGNGCPKGATAQMRLLYTYHVHHPDDIW